MKNNLLQSMVNGLNTEWQKERAKSQMTLGKLILTLELLDSDREISGIGEPDSYRGYYSDLAFKPTDKKVTVEALFKLCQNCMGREFTGYKGGEFLMGENTPLWIASYGDCGNRLMGLDDSKKIIIPKTEPEEE
jgi:hypothetical protein